MKKLNEILIYSDVSDRYYTDGKDVYHKMIKEHNAKKYRIRYLGERYNLNEDNVDEINKITKRCYMFLDGILYKKMKWFLDHDGYKMLTTDVKKKPTKISQHRLVYFYVNNIKPQSGYVIDHINQDKTDNTLSNLRLVTCKMNSNNIDKKRQSLKLSKYLYGCIDMSSGCECVSGTAGEISEYIGIDSGLVNRYAKHSYIYRGRYQIYIASSKNMEGIWTQK